MTGLCVGAFKQMGLGFSEQFEYGDSCLFIRDVKFSGIISLIISSYLVSSVLFWNFS